MCSDGLYTESYSLSVSDHKEVSGPCVLKLSHGVVATVVHSAEHANFLVEISRECILSELRPQ